MATCYGTCKGVCSSACSTNGTNEGRQTTCDSGGERPSWGSQLRDERRVQYYPSSGRWCSCGSDCAGCGGCSQKCSGCSGDCTGCSGSCGGSCSGTCSNGCSYTCTGNCKGYCKGTCNDGCKGSCKTACTGQCSHLCNMGCRSNVAIDAYKHLSKHDKASNKEYTFDTHQSKSDDILLDWLDKEDINHLFGIIQEEGRRRVLKKTGRYTQGTDDENTPGQTLTRAEEIRIGVRDERGNLISTKTGEFVDDEKHIKRLINLFADNTGKSVSLSVGGTTTSEGKEIKKSIAKTLIEKSLKCYEDMIPVHTTSEESGKETK